MSADPDQIMGTQLAEENIKQGQRTFCIQFYFDKQNAEYILGDT